MYSFLISIISNLRAYPLSRDSLCFWMSSAGEKFIVERDFEQFMDGWMIPVGEGEPFSRVNGHDHNA